MRIFKYQFILACCLIMFTSTMMVSCDKKDDVTVTGDNLDKLILSNSDLSIFQAALVKTRLTQFTQGGGPFTIFAPTNAAFAAMGISSVADLASIDSNSLVQLLTYHIQSGRRSFTEIPLGPNANMATQGGFTLYGARYPDGQAFINGSKINSYTAASNGFLYIIDKVLVPGSLSAANSLLINNNYKLMLQALNKTVVTTVTNPATIFAVPNSVMIAAGYDSTSIATMLTSSAAFTTLKSIMQYHIVPQRIFTPNMKAGPLKTVQGTNVTIGLGTPRTVKGTNNPTPFNIVVPDLLTSTGVIQGINGLLKP